MVAAIILTILTCYVVAQLVQFSTNPNTGTVTGDELVTYTIDDIETTAGDTINWGNLQIGENTKTLNITNIHTDGVKVFLCYSNLPEGWTLEWVGNKTTNTGNLLNVEEYVNEPITLTVPEGTPANEYTWTTAIYAEEV